MVEVANKEEEDEEVEQAETEVELREDKVTLELLINTRYCVVL